MEETTANTASYAISARFLEIRGSLNGRLTNSEELEFFFFLLRAISFSPLLSFFLFFSSFSSLRFARFYFPEIFIRIDKFEMKIIRPCILNFVANKFVSRNGLSCISIYFNLRLFNFNLINYSLANYQF